MLDIMHVNCYILSVVILAEGLVALRRSALVSSFLSYSHKMTSNASCCFCRSS